MTAPNVYQYRHYSNHLRKQALSLACARDAIRELVDMGFTVTSFSLGQRASITVQQPYERTDMEFDAVSIGFNGAFHYTTYGAKFGLIEVEWRKRRYIASAPLSTSGGIKSVPCRQLRIMGERL